MISSGSFLSFLSSDLLPSVTESLGSCDSLSPSSAVGGGGTVSPSFFFFLGCFYYPFFIIKTTLFIRHVLYIGLIAVFVGCASATTEITATPPDAAQVGRALDEGNYRGAILYLEQPGVSAHADLPLLMLTARAYKAASDDVNLYSAIQRILEIDPYNAFGLEQMGLISLSRGDLETAEKFLTLAVSVEAERWMSWNGLGIIADADARHEKAREYFNKALEIMPGHPKVLANLGWSRLLDNVYSEKNDMDRRY